MEILLDKTSPYTSIIMEYYCIYVITYDISIILLVDSVQIQNTTNNSGTKIDFLPDIKFGHFCVGLFFTQCQCSFSVVKVVLCKINYSLRWNFYLKKLIGIIFHSFQSWKRNKLINCSRQNFSIEKSYCLKLHCIKNCKNIFAKLCMHKVTKEII